MTFAPTTPMDSAAARRHEREQTIAAYWKKKQEAKEAIAQHKPATDEMDQAGIAKAIAEFERFAQRILTLAERIEERQAAYLPIAAPPPPVSPSPQPEQQGNYLILHEGYMEMTDLPVTFSNEPVEELVFPDNEDPDDTQERPIVKVPRRQRFTRLSDQPIQRWLDQSLQDAGEELGHTSQHIYIHPEFLLWVQCATGYIEKMYANALGTYEFRMDTDLPLDVITID